MLPENNALVSQLLKVRRRQIVSVWTDVPARIMRMDIKYVWFIHFKPSVPGACPRMK
jgi:hypothetical protein